MQPDLFAGLESDSKATRKSDLSSSCGPRCQDPALVLAILRKSPLRPNPEVVRIYEALVAGREG